MLSRRILVLTGLSALALPTTPARAGWKDALDWFLNLVGASNVTLDDIYLFLLKAKLVYSTLTDSRRRLEDVRRKLQDDSSGNALRSKLDEWLTRFDAYLLLQPRQGEGPVEFNARREQERAKLEAEWRKCRRDAVAALKEIETLGVQLESIDPAAIPNGEWGVFRKLLADEKTFAEFIDMDMPTDPDALARLRKAAHGLNRLVMTIDSNREALNAAIRKAG
ncbi:hypothetical protein V5F29_01340 [Xanthobacter aminoxidans]|uniref:hypothetical protein n=1 Tax=Xanthobacter aminoxidans TaxID=186280 RepID=UPI00372CCFFD